MNKKPYKYRLSNILTSIGFWLAPAIFAVSRISYIYFTAFQAFCDEIGDSRIACPPIWKGTSTFLGTV